MVKVAIVGASGYTALELIKLLLNHPQVEIAALTTRQEGSPPISALHPSLAGRLDLPCENLSPAEVASRASFVFTALPHVAAMGGGAGFAGAPVPRHRSECRLSLSRCGRLREVVRPFPHRCGPSREDRLRTAGAVWRKDSAGRPDRQSRLLHQHFDPWARAVSVRPADRSEGHHYRRQKRRHRAQGGCPSCISCSASATKVLPRTRSAITGTSRRSTRS